MTTTNCTDPNTPHEHCPIHGCVEYVCCVPTHTTRILDIARDMFDSYAIAADAARVGDEQAAQSNFDDAEISKAFILDRLARL